MNKRLLTDSDLFQLIGVFAVFSAPYYSSAYTDLAKWASGYDYIHKMYWGPFYQRESTLTPAWISNVTNHKVYNEMYYPFLNNGAAVEVW